MNYPYRPLLRTSIVLPALIGAAFGVLTPASGQSGTAKESSTAKESGTAKDFVIDDWSHHHLVFSNPASLPDDVREKIVKDPRYQMQQRRRSMGQRPVVAQGFASPAVSRKSSLSLGTISAARKKKENLKTDWSVSLGGVAATLTGVVGTLSSSSISGSSTLKVGGVTFDASAPTAASAMGTFAGNPTNGQTVTIGGSEVLTASLSTPASQTGTFASPPTTSSSITVVNGSNTLTLTTSATTGSYASLTFTGTSATTGSITIVYTGGATSNTLVMTAGSSNSCSSSTAGTFAATSTTSSTRATNFNMAIGMCPSTIGVTSSRSGSAITLTAVLPGSFLPTVTNSLTHTTSGTLTTGSNGSNACTSSTTGTFATSNLTTTLAQNLSSAINLCPTGTGLTNTSAVNGSSVTVTASTWGTSSISLTPTSGFFAWASGTLTGGTSGTNTGTSFAIDNVNADAATNLAAAITRNGGTVGVTATSAGAVVAVTATPGTGGNSITLAETLSNFGWSPSTTLSGGTDGTTSGTSTPPTFAYWSVNAYLLPAQVATNISTAINANATLQLSAGVTAANNSPASGDVTFTANEVGTSGNSIAVTPSAFSAWTPSSTTDLTGGTSPTGGQVQPNAYPAKFSFGTSSADCTNDFVVYPTGVAGASATNVSTIVAYNGIYSGCSGNVPSLYWSYNTGTGDTVATSPIISFDNTGSQIAFIQSTGTAASLVLLKWSPNTSGTLTNQTSGVNYQNCTAPCMYSMPFGNGKNDTLSSPFYDYHGDALYVGDDSGNLHQFTGVFNGAPAENITSPWPVNLGTNKLASPVYDGTWDAVFVGDLVGGLHCVTSTTGSCQESQTSLGGGWYTSSATPASGGQIADAPLINSSANYLLVFVNTSTSNTVYGYSEQFFANSPGSVSVGTGATGYYLYAGAYDNLYYQSPNNNTGNMYVVGNTGVTTGATLYQVALSGGFLAGSTALVPGLTTSATNAFPWPSPVTEFCNPGTNSACAIETASASGCTVSTSSTTLSCTTGNFTSSDVGLSITGTDIPTGTTVTGFTSSTKITMSAKGTANISTGTATIGQTTTGADYVFFSVNRANTGSPCSGSSATGCILSYNVSNPSSVAIAGSGLSVTTPGTKGCWATGGIVIDNAVQSGTLAGASEIYFVNLNGNNVGGTGAPGNCTIGSSANITGVQTSQANPN